MINRKGKTDRCSFSNSKQDPLIYPTTNKLERNDDEKQDIEKLAFLCAIYPEMIKKVTGGTGERKTAIVTTATIKVDDEKKKWLVCSLVEKRRAFYLIIPHYGI